MGVSHWAEKSAGLIYFTYFTYLTYLIGCLWALWAWWGLPRAYRLQLLDLPYWLPRVHRPHLLDQPIMAHGFRFEVVFGMVKVMVYRIMVV